MTSTPGLDVRRDGALLRIALDRPDQRNALDRDMTRGLIDRIETAPDDEGLRAILLTARGEHFCAGADWVALNAPDPEGRRPRTGGIQRRLPRLAHRLIPALLRVQLPVVCAVRGFAAGIGCHLALACDFTVASRTARFWEPFATRGFTPDSGGSWLLPRLVGLARAKEMLLLGRELDAERAERWGLVYRVVDDAELDGAAEALAAELAGAATVAVGLSKWLLHRSLELDLEHALENEALALELSARSLDFKEGLAAFRERRPPRFDGR